jgi:hypothetical protein
VKIRMKMTFHDFAPVKSLTIAFVSLSGRPTILYKKVSFY